MARPSKLNAERTAIICDALRECMPYEQAARLADIDVATFRRWRRRGENPTTARDKPFEAFSAAVKKAEAEAQRELVRRIANPDADKAKGWQRWAWLLERRWPEVWAQRQPEAAQREEIVVDLVEGDD